MLAPQALEFVEVLEQQLGLLLVAVVDEEEEEVVVVEEQVLDVEVQVVVDVRVRVLVLVWELVAAVEEVVVVVLQALDSLLSMLKGKDHFGTGRDMKRIVAQKCKALARSSFQQDHNCKLQCDPLEYLVRT